ncbi:MAG: VanZ family protein, partial [bacterium]
ATAARWSAVAAYVAIIFTLSAQPSLSLPGTFELRDKVAHVCEYGGLGLLVWRATRASWPTASPLRRAVLAAIAVAAVGAADERFQATVPGRFADVYDWIADVTGATLAQVVGMALERRRGGA